MAKDILERADLASAGAQFVVACAASREHDRLAAEALEKFGAHGPQISGCVRDHFPSDVKDKLRALARDVTTYSDRGYALRPSRVRLDTMRHLARSIATRDGSGFYGPQPYRSAAR